MLNAPCRRPAAPKPAKALPVMNAGEVGAAAQTTDPTGRALVAIHGWCSKLWVAVISDPVNLPSKRKMETR